MKTIQEKVEAALAEAGWYEVQRHKWTTLHPASVGTYIYTGLNGSVRRGRNKASSRPVVETLKQVWIDRGETLLNPRRFHQL